MVSTMIQRFLPLLSFLLNSKPKLIKLDIGISSSLGNFYSSFFLEFIYFPQISNWWLSGNLEVLIFLIITLLILWNTPNSKQRFILLKSIISPSLLLRFFPNLEKNKDHSCFEQSSMNSTRFEYINMIVILQHTPQVISPRRKEYARLFWREHRKTKFSSM